MVPDGLWLCRNPNHPPAAVRLCQHDGHRQVGLAEAVRDGDLALLDAAFHDRVNAHASYEHFDQTPLQFPGDRLVQRCPPLDQSLPSGFRNLGFAHTAELLLNRRREIAALNRLPLIPCRRERFGGRVQNLQ